jgi:hypothetical protein
MRCPAKVAKRFVEETLILFGVSLGVDLDRGHKQQHDHRTVEQAHDAGPGEPSKDGEDEQRKVEGSLPREVDPLLARMVESIWRISSRLVAFCA